MRKARYQADEWDCMSEALQLSLSQNAMLKASVIIADQATLFAVQFRKGTLQDRGAVDALNLFAHLLRETSTECLGPVGNA